MAIAKSWIVLGVLGLVVLVMVGSMVSAYNALVTERTAVETQSKQVDVQYQRSFTLLPQMIQLAERYLRNETSVQQSVAGLRSGACSGALKAGDLNQKDQCASDVAASGNLIIKVVNENYPNLKGVTLYENVQTETVNTANKIATEKGRYNDIAGAYNTHRQKCCMPVFVANTFGFKPALLIGYSDRPNQTSFGNNTL